MKKDRKTASQQNTTVVPGQIVDKNLYNQLLALKQVKDESSIIFSAYTHQGVNVSKEDEVAMSENLDSCMRILSCLVRDKFEFDLQKGGRL